jgi:hypothetical protein
LIQIAESPSKVIKTLFAWRIQVQRRLRQRQKAEQPWLEHWGPAHDDEEERAPDSCDVLSMGGEPTKIVYADPEPEPPPPSVTVTQNQDDEELWRAAQQLLEALRRRAEKR